jgi:hypothetical protein
MEQKRACINRRSGEYCPVMESFGQSREASGSVFAQVRSLTLRGSEIGNV